MALLDNARMAWIRVIDKAKVRLFTEIQDVPLPVTSGHFTTSGGCPLYPRKRTSQYAIPLDLRAPIAAHAPAKSSGVVMPRCSKSSGRNSGI